MARKQMTVKEKEYAIELFHQGKNTVEIANILDRNDSTIGALLKRNGLQARGKENKCSQEVIDKIIFHYMEGQLSTVKIGEMFGVSERTVAKYLTDNDIPLRKGGVISKITEDDYFETINNQNKAYLLGLIITDGGIVVDSRGKRSNSLSVTLKSEDRYILEFISRELGGNGEDNVYDASKRDESTFRVGNEKITSDLAKYGVVPQKTHTAYLPEIDEALMPHLIRGIFDGDGTVYIKEGVNRPYLRFGFYGTPKILEQIKSYLIEKIGITDCKIVHKDGVSFVTFGKPKDVKNFYSLIYNNATHYLIRKKKKFDYFLDFV
jgi:intein-encoded DNA endonuclease-like protein